ncbi:hypothetical protein B6V73_19375 [Thioclava sp. JM3]|nr:hypothetical protein B6V73_19375 [Thioclava sp. JM3]
MRCEKTPRCAAEWIGRPSETACIATTERGWRGWRTAWPRRPRGSSMRRRSPSLPAGVEAGPDGVVRWRRQDLRARIAERFGIELHERTVGKYLAMLGYRRLSVLPHHPKSDPAAQALLKNFPIIHEKKQEVHQTRVRQLRPTALPATNLGDPLRLLRSTCRAASPGRVMRCPSSGILGQLAA